MTPTPAREAQEVLSRCEECGRQYWSDVEAEGGCIVGATPCPYCRCDFLATALERHAMDLKEARTAARTLYAEVYRLQGEVEGLERKCGGLILRAEAVISAWKRSEAVTR